MSWKSTARSIPTSRIKKEWEKAAKENPRTFYRKSMIKKHGKPFVVRDHVRDFISENEETGKRYVEASTKFRRGNYIFPTHYLHPKKKFIGKTKDIRYTDENGWEIYLDGVLRDFSTGAPVLFDGLEIDCSGWYREKDLKDAGLGLSQIKPGASLPSEDQIMADRASRIRRKIH